MSEVDLFGVESRPRGAIGSHESHSGGTDEWLTPPWLIQALGSFDLDPCSPRERPWDTAAQHYTIENDGLRQPWQGAVWLNPPYSQAARWLHRLAEHGIGTALIFARTETALWFDHVWSRATALLFIRGRLTFHYPSGKPAAANSGAPSVLVAYGDHEAQRLAYAAIEGHFVNLRSPGRNGPPCEMCNGTGRDRVPGWRCRACLGHGRCYEPGDAP